MAVLAAFAAFATLAGLNRSGAFAATPPAVPGPGPGAANAAASPRVPPGPATPAKAPLVRGWSYEAEPGGPPRRRVLLEWIASPTFTGWFSEGELYQGIEVSRILPEAGRVTLLDVARKTAIELGQAEHAKGPAGREGLRLDQARFMAALEFYQEISDRTVLSHSRLEGLRLDIALPPSTRKEMATALEGLFARNDVVLKTVGDKFAFVAGRADAAVLETIPPPPPPPPPPAPAPAPAPAPTPAPAQATQPHAADLLPPGLMKFTAADPSQVEEIWQELAGVTLLSAGRFPANKISLRTQTEISRSEATWVLEAALRIAGVAVVRGSENLAFAMPVAEAENVPTFDRQRSLARSVRAATPTDAFRSIEADPAKLAELYTSVTGRTLEPPQTGFPDGRFRVRLRALPDQAEAIYLLESLAWTEGWWFEPVGQRGFRLFKPARRAP